MEHRPATSPTSAPRPPAWARWLPIVGWLRRSDGASRRADLVAGLTVGAMLVPQGMAYASLAGMPPVTGLYAATVPLVVYALLGTSGQLAFGPVAIVSLLTASTLAPLADGDPSAYVALAGLLALLVGAIQLGLGLLRAGRLTAMLSHPVVSGFTSAAAIVIATSQLDKLLGLELSRASGWLPQIRDLAGSLGATHLPTLAVGAAALLLLLLGRRVGKRLPIALVVVVAATLVAPWLGLPGLGVEVVGEVPRGLPTPTLPLAPLDSLVALLPGAMIIALLSYLEGISVARAVARRTGDRLDPDQELRASGAANLAAGLLQAFPVAGGFSRTAVNHDAGARTPLASIVSAVTVVLALVLLAPMLATLPEAVLAAIVLAAVVSLVDVGEARQAWRVERTDGLALVVTFLATLLIGVEIGIGVGIAASLLLSLWRVGVPTLEVEVVGSTTRVRVEGVLLPASGVRLVEQLDAALMTTGPADDPSEPRKVDLEVSGVPSADLSGVQALAAVDELCRQRGATLRLLGVRAGVAEPLARAGLLDRFAGRLIRHPECPDNAGRSGQVGPHRHLDHEPSTHVLPTTPPSSR